MENKQENLRELIEKFMDPQNAQMYLDDIEAGERILRKYPAPKPDEMLLANIKANIALQKTPQRTVTFRKRVIEAIAVAASIIIIAAISLQSFNETPSPPPDAPPFTGGFTYNNTLVPILNNQLDEISKKIIQVSMNATTYDYQPNAYDEYNKEIQELENRIYNVGTVQDEYTYTDINKSSIFEDLDDLENRINELNDSLRQNDYSNSDAFEI